MSPASELLSPLQDKRCRAGALDNGLRRRLAPAGRELDLLDIREGQSVADLGTGVGFLLPELLRRVGPMGHVLALDPDQRNLSLARARVSGDTRVKFVLGSASEPHGFPPGSQDRVLLSLVLCCLVDKKGTMAQAWDLLRPGGLVLASYPRIRAPWRRASRSLRVSPERWDALRSQFPWEELPAPRGRFVTRHLLRKPSKS